MKNTLCWAALLLVLAGCQKSANSTPASSMAATISSEPDYLVENVPAGRAILSSDADTTTSPGRLSLSSQSGSAYLGFMVCKFQGVGTYIIRANPALTKFVSNAYYERASNSGDRKYITQYLLPVGSVVGQVVVSSFDRASHHVQGTFSFTGTLLNQQGQPTGTPIQVSNGRFDIYNLTVW